MQSYASKELNELNQTTRRRQTQIKEQKTTENQSSGIKIESTPALYLTTNNVS